MPQGSKSVFAPDLFFKESNPSINWSNEDAQELSTYYYSTLRLDGRHQAKCQLKTRQKVYDSRDRGDGVHAETKYETGENHRSKVHGDCDVIYSGIEAIKGTCLRSF
jgi:hypothetical protein